MSSKALFSQENPGAFRYLIWVEKVPHPFLSPARYQLGYLAGRIWGHYESTHRLPLQGKLFIP